MEWIEQVRNVQAPPTIKSHWSKSLSDYRISNIWLATIVSRTAAFSLSVFRQNYAKHHVTCRSCRLLSPHLILNRKPVYSYPVMTGFLPYLLHRAPRHPAGGESDPQLVHVDPSVLVQIQLLEELGPEPLALGVDPAVLASRPRPSRAASARPHDDIRARSPAETHRLGQRRKTRSACVQKRSC